MKVDILIPVYNRPEKLRDLLFSVERNSNPELIGEIVIGDDASDPETRAFLDRIEKTHPKIRILRNETNLGFGANCTRLFESTDGPVAVLLNSDTLVPPQWLERMKAPFVQDETIALATPLSNQAANHSVRCRPGQSWLDIDLALSTRPTLYPDACTAIGFCLGIRRSAMKGALFNPDYEQGYGEDTDLHYRVLQEGHRSVIVDNLLICHDEGSSFQATEERSTLLEKNRELFFRQWGEQHKKDWQEKWVANNPLASIRTDKEQFSLNQTGKHVDALFVLPGCLPKIGGIEVVVRLVHWLQLRGVRAEIYSFGPCDPDYCSSYHPYDDVDELSQAVKSVGRVWATSFDSTKHARQLAHHYGTKLGYFVQGPEAAFESGINFDQTVAEYRLIDTIMTGSQFLKDYVETYGAKNVTNLGLSPDPLFYYPQPGIEREPKSIAACVRKAPGKGTGILLHNLELAKQAGFQVYLFGKDLGDYSIPDTLAKKLGDLDPLQIRKLFSKVTYYLDCSHFEGLGLIPLEAAYCGTIPLLTEKGGTEDSFRPGDNCLYLPDPFRNMAFFKELGEIPHERLGRLQSSAMAMREEKLDHDAFAVFAKATGSALDQRREDRPQFVVPKATAVVKPLKKKLKTFIARCLGHLLNVAMRETGTDDRIENIEKEIRRTRLLLVDWSHQQTQHWTDQKREMRHVSSRIGEERRDPPLLN